MNNNIPIDKKNLIPEAMSIRINQMTYDLQQAGHDPVVLSSGEAFFDLPLFDFTKLDVNKGFHYSDSQGLPGLRKLISEYYNDKYFAASGKNNILITAGSKFAIYAALRSILMDGDEVLLQEPCWLSYPEQIKLAGGIPKYVPYDVDIERLPNYFTDRTKMVIICNPNNPAGRIYSRSQLLELAEQTKCKNIYLLADEAYSDYTIGTEYKSLASISHDLDHVVVVNSLSKNMGMSGWRIGYAIANSELINRMLRVNQHLITCAPTLLCQYIEKYFHKILSITLPQVQEVVEKRTAVAKMVDKLSMKRIPGDATFYMMLSIDDYPGSSVEFAKHLLLKNLIAVVPGVSYGKSTDRFVRIGVGIESKARIWDALQTINSIIKSKSIPQIDETQMMKDLCPHLRSD